MGEIHELFVLAVPLVWFAGATPERRWRFSEAWGPPQFQERRSRSEKAILGALGKFRGILGAALGIQRPILGMRNSILGMASHHLSNTRTTILGATPGAILKDCHLPLHSRSFFFKNKGGSPKKWRFSSMVLVEAIFEALVCL